MKNLFVIAMLVFLAAFAIMMASRLPVDAMTVLVGVGCGVLASIPTSVLVLALATKHNLDEQRYHHGARDIPQVIVISSPGNAVSDMAGYQHGAGRYMVPVRDAKLPPRFTDYD